jgi:hypothetical protein
MIGYVARSVPLLALLALTALFALLNSPRVLSAADRQEVVAQAGTQTGAPPAEKSDSNADQPPTRRKTAAGATPVLLTPERELAALKFVEQHHPELAELIAALKTMNPVQYGQAIQDLFRASERIGMARSRDPRRHELELQLWKTQSRRDLVAVRLRMARTAELESQLRQLIQEHWELQQSLLRLERERVAERLRKLDEQLASGNRAAQVEQQFQQMVLRPRIGPKSGAKNAARPAAKPTSKPGSNSASKPGSKPGSKSIAPPTSKSATKPAAKSDVKPVEEDSEGTAVPANEPAASRPATEPSTPAATPAADPATQVPPKATGKPAP